MHECPCRIAWSMQHLYERISISNFVRGQGKGWTRIEPTRDDHRARAWLLHVDDLVQKESCVLYAVTLYSLKDGC
jgi:hypothetical protein